jgi:hypothetical protein
MTCKGAGGKTSRKGRRVRIDNSNTDPVKFSYGRVAPVAAESRTMNPSRGCPAKKLKREPEAQSPKAGGSPHRREVVIPEHKPGCPAPCIFCKGRVSPQLKLPEV